ncbi:MAG TPA: electron transfer flavoprotein subunit alpha/FixB family protein [Thermoleophilaceae bacterium]|nr:electron transfer flavoprotein subunit alpha/FixB family protein [Thermoleophilaceae bacterium]
MLVLVEHQDGRPDELSLQALALARALAGEAPLEALLMGPGGGDAAEELGAHGVTTAHVAEDDRLAAYAPAAWARCVTDAIETTAPGAVVAAGSNRGNEVMAHVAARLDLPFAANCTTANEDGTVTRVRWGGSLLEEARLKGSPLLLSCAPHAVQPATVNGEAVEVRRLEPGLEASDLTVQVKERVQAETKGISLAEAKVVISGGRGVGSAEGFGILEELAGLLNAAVGCSRVVTMAGWRPHTDQVGQTGTRVSPDLYIACGISGATQHIAGCKGAKKILAINSDAEAPILNNADYAVIGDLTEIVPAITAELKREPPG